MLENNNNTSTSASAIHPFASSDRQNNYVNLVRKNLYKTRVAKPVDAIANQEGLRRACSEPNSFYIHGNVLHLAGTQIGRTFTTYHNGQPWGDAVQDTWDDLKIPCHVTSHSLRYKEAKEVFNTQSKYNPCERPFAWWRSCFTTSKRNAKT